MIKGATNGVNIEKEFAQFVFSMLFESLEKILVGSLLVYLAAVFSVGLPVFLLKQDTGRPTLKKKTVAR